MDQVKVKQDDFTLCPKFTETFAMLGKKWNGLIIEVLLHEHTQRFKDRVLCERLKELEENGIVSRNTYPGESRVDYSLTERGRDLAPVMEAVHEWSDQWCGKD